MGGTTVRAHTLGVSVGNPLSVEPSLDEFNEEAYLAIDFAIVAAKLYGLKVCTFYLDKLRTVSHLVLAFDSIGRQCECNVHVFGVIISSQDRTSSTTIIMVENISSFNGMESILPV